MKSQRSFLFGGSRRRPASRSTAQPKIFQARTATHEEIEDNDNSYEDEQAPPSIRFSQAIIVVLVLHVIAIGGFLAFNTVRENKKAATEAIAAAKSKEIGIPNAQPVQVPPDMPALATHTIASGDTLSKIARKYSVSAQSIAKSNNMEITAKLHIGQVLKLPKEAKGIVRADLVSALPSALRSPAASSPSAAPAKPTAVRATPKPSAATPAKSASSYTVAKGDTARAIAQKFGVPYQDLIKTNGIKDPTKIQPGQKLKIPKK